MTVLFFLFLHGSGVFIVLRWEISFLPTKFPMQVRNQLSFGATTESRKQKSKRKSGTINQSLPVLKVNHHRAETGGTIWWVRSYLQLQRSEASNSPSWQGCRLWRPQPPMSSFLLRNLPHPWLHNMSRKYCKYRCDYEHACTGFSKHHHPGGYVSKQTRLSVFKSLKSDVRLISHDLQWDTTVKDVSHKQ